MKVEIDFPADFETDTILPIHLGRLYIGEGVARLFFGTDGKLHIMLSRSQEKFIHFYDDEQIVYGFGAAK